MHQMKKLILLSLLTLQFSLLIAQDTGEQVRLSRLFNFGWKFQTGDLKDAYSLNYDDSNWRVLDLPHDFQIEQVERVALKRWEPVGIVRLSKLNLSGKENEYCLILRELC